MVVKHHVGRSQALQPTDGDQAGIARAGADDVDERSDAHRTLRVTGDGERSRADGSKADRRLAFVADCARASKHKDARTIRQTR